MTRPNLVTAKPERAAGAVVFWRSTRGARVLVLRTGERWEFPLAPIDDGDDAFDCARRGLAGATGLEDLDFPFGKDAWKETIPYATGRIERYFLAETEAASVALPEHPARPAQDAWRWVSFEEAEDLLPPRLALVLDWARATITGN